MIKSISTGDGSCSLFVEELNETYHSRHGAIQESNYVFIDMGLKKVLESEVIQVLEIGMGTGLNVLLSSIFANEHKKRIHLTTLEPFPIEPSLLEEMNYAELIDHDSSKKYFDLIHESSWDKKTELGNFFSLTKGKIKLEDFQSSQKFDIVFYDAFGPHAQPELWEEDVFSYLSQFLNSGSILVTYCAQGQFRRNLKKVGFEVEKLPGPPGKREMTRAIFKC